MTRILVAAHGHPEARAGGAERAAYSLFDALQQTSGIEATFLANAGAGELGHDGVFGAFRGRPNEILWAAPPVDHFRYVSRDYEAMREQFMGLLDRVRPDLVHVHHYFHTSLDLFRVLEEANIPSVLTLHEYLLICHNAGQMIRRPSGLLCPQSSFAECHGCYPDYSSGQFFLRKRMIENRLDTVDRLVSPSEFLIDRYADWGLSREKIVSIGNVLPRNMLPTGPRRERRDDEIRIGYFGQINPFKGVDLLLQAIGQLPEDVVGRVRLVIYGANLSDQQFAFRERIEELLRQHEGVVSFFGRYQNADVVRLMGDLDWVVVPSIWYENSPLVIEEAKIAGTPILAADIGGMAEKVRHGQDGLHFPARSSAGLAATLTAIARGEVRTPAPEPANLDAVNAERLEAHLALYSSLSPSQ